MMRRGRVYVTQKPPTRRRNDGVFVPMINLTPAETFGELIYLANRGEVEDATENSLLWLMRERLKDFDTTLDYIMPIGHTISMITAAVAALERSDGTLRIMQWDKRVQQYEIFTLDIEAQPIQRAS